MVMAMTFKKITGHKKQDVDEKKALEMINKGIQKGRYILIECDDGTNLTSADAVHTKDGKKKKLFVDKAKDIMTPTKKGKKKGKKAKSVKEIEPIAGG